MKFSKKKILFTGLGLAAIYLLFNRGRKIKRTGLSFRYISEVGNNAGFNNAVFEKMLSENGWNSGEQWCMYYAKSIYNTALPGLKNDFNKSLSGSSQSSFNNVKAGKSKSLEINNGRPEVGNIVIWTNYSNSSKGHAGIVTKVYGNYFDTVEGNTYEPGISTNNEIVAVVPGHKINVGEKSNVYPSKKLRGFIRLK